MSVVEGGPSSRQVGDSSRFPHHGGDLGSPHGRFPETIPLTAERRVSTRTVMVQVQLPSTDPNIITRLLQWRSVRLCKLFVGLVCTVILATMSFRIMISQQDAVGNKQGQVHSSHCEEKKDGSPCDLVFLTEKPATWQVVFLGSVNVRQIKDLSSKIIGLKWKCDHFVGRQEGMWVKLFNEPGYVIQQLGGIILLRKSSMYDKNPHGSCADVGMRPVDDARMCQEAGFVLGVANTSVQRFSQAESASTANLVGKDEHDEHCYLVDGKSLLIGALSRLSKATRHERIESICLSPSDHTCRPFVTTTSTTKSRHPPTTITRTTQPTTTLQPSTTTFTSTWGPTFFCFTVVRLGTEEPEMIRKQLELRIGIFACEEFTAFSHGGSMKLGMDWNLGRIQAEPATRSQTGQWLNIAVFLEAWTMVVGDVRYRKHDWVVKADPDTVFFPDRLREHVRAHTTREGSNVFYLNCNSGSQARMLGSLEVFSSTAIDVFKEEGWKCKDMAWKSTFTEDTYMEKCMKNLGSYPALDFDMVADERCQPASCLNPGKAAFHPYPSIQSWMECMHQSGG